MQTDRHANRQTDMQTADRQTNRQTDAIVSGSLTEVNHANYVKVSYSCKTNKLYHC